MSTEKMKRDDVRQILLSLVLARKGATAIPVLDNDYYQAEKMRIPWRQFGYANLLEFIRSMPEHFVVQFYNGNHYVRGIASEKSKHVSSLVSRQKQNTMKYLPPRFQNRYPLNYSVPRMHIRRIPAEQLNILVQYVKSYPNGVSMQTAMLVMQKQLPHVVLTMHDLQQQLHELTHQIYLDGEIIRPVKSENNNYYRKITNHQPLLSQEDVARSTAEVTYGVPGDESDANFNHNGDSIRVDFVDHDIKGLKEGEQLETNFNREQMYDHRHDSDDVDEYITDTEKSEHYERNDMSKLISERTRSRLEKLMRKNPDGIWCTELPQKYLEEYKVSLNYSNLGFNSVRQYVACLPEIFYMKQHITRDDFILFSADTRPKNQDQLSKSYIQELSGKNVHETTPTTESDVKDLYNLHDVDDDDDIAPFPSDVNVSVFEKFAPRGAMAYDESVGQILVTDLNCGRKKFLESYVVEVFTPSFFWIHLRQNRKYLNALMDDLGKFYKQNSETYAIPKLALKRGLNCACLYDNIWHRGIIKTVKPDFRVTVMCYDYGTLKTYAPEEVYYLHNKFSHLAAQAIPCGLYNIRPNVGDRWKKSITNRFVERISERLLAATIISIDPPNNSMLIVLTDTSEENDVHINDWLVQENLARRGKMVRMLSGENFSFRHYMCCNSTTSRFYKTTEAKNAIVTDVDRRDKDQSMLCDKKTRRSFYVENEDVRKNVEALHNVPIGKKAMQIRDIKPITETDSKLNKKNRGPKELVMLLEKLKTLNAVSSDFGTNTFSSKTINDFGDDTQRKDLESVINIKPQSNDNLPNYDDSNAESVKKFNVMDSDNEQESENYFGTFQSVCGGHGMMEPFDWSVIKSNDNYRTTTSYNIISNSVIVQEHSNKTKDKSNKNFHNPENKTAARSYFLTFLLKEDAYYLVENNIDYDIRNASQSVTKLKNRMKMYNDKHTALVMKKKTLEALRSSVCSRDIPNPDTDIIESDGASSSSKEIVFREAVNEVSIDGSSEVYKTNQEKFERDDLNMNVEAYSNGNDNDNYKNVDIPEYTKSSETNTSKDKIHNRRFRTLLEHMKRLQSLDSSFDSNTKESTNNERFQSSDSNNRNSSDETMISSDDDQNEAYSQKNGMARFNKLRNFTAKSTSPTLISSSDKLDNDSEAQVLLREDDNAFSTNIVDSKQYQLNKIDESHASKTLLQVLKMQQNMASVNELDSDDLSSQETDDDRSTKNDESNNESADVSDIACNFINNDDCKNMFDEEITPPVFNDRDTDYNECDDIEFDGCRWDIYATPEHFSFQPNSLPNSEVQIVEISDNESESKGNVS